MKIYQTQFRQGARDDDARIRNLMRRVDGLERRIMELEGVKIDRPIQVITKVVKAKRA